MYCDVDANSCGSDWFSAAVLIVKFYLKCGSDVGSMVT